MFFAGLEQNPCDDRRHISIWSSKKSCKKIPNFLIVGPQKTGNCLYVFIAYLQFLLNIVYLVWLVAWFLFGYVSC